MSKIIANVKVEVGGKPSPYDPILRKIEGTYLLKKSFGEYRIIMDREPVEGLPTIEALVEDKLENVEFVTGVRVPTFIDRIFPFRGQKKKYLKGRMEGHAHQKEDNSHLGIDKEKAFYFYTEKELKMEDIEHLNWGKIDEILGIDASERPW